MKKIIFYPLVTLIVVMMTNTICLAQNDKPTVRRMTFNDYFWVLNSDEYRANLKTDADKAKYNADLDSMQAVSHTGVEKEMVMFEKFHSLDLTVLKDELLTLTKKQEELLLNQKELIKSIGITEWFHKVNFNTNAAIILERSIQEAASKQRSLCLSAIKELTIKEDKVVITYDPSKYTEAQARDYYEKYLKNNFKKDK
jgi:hypothetical protein